MFWQMTLFDCIAAAIGVVAALLLPQKKREETNINSANENPKPLTKQTYTIAGETKHGYYDPETASFYVVEQGETSQRERELGVPARDDFYRKGSKHAFRCYEERDAEMCRLREAGYILHYPHQTSPAPCRDEPPHFQIIATPDTVVSPFILKLTIDGVAQTIPCADVQKRLDGIVVIANDGTRYYVPSMSSVQMVWIRHLEKTGYIDLSHLRCEILPIYSTCCIDIAPNFGYHDLMTKAVLEGCG